MGSIGEPWQWLAGLSGNAEECGLRPSCLGLVHDKEGSGLAVKGSQQGNNANNR